MKRKRGPGHPVTTGSASNAPVRYRVTDAELADLEAEGKTHRPRLSPSQVAKRRAFPRTPSRGTR